MAAAGSDKTNRNIYVAGGDSGNCAALGAALEAGGYSVIRAGTVCDLNRLLRRNKPALVLLETEFPDGNGLDVCRRIRAGLEAAFTPVLLLGTKTDLAGKKRAFDAGCDAYFEKPVAPEEVLLWVRAFLRGRNAAGAPHGDAIISEGLEVYPAAGVVSFEGVRIAGLTRRELTLLAALVRNAPRILPKSRIIGEVWRTAATKTLVSAHLFNLRKKLPEKLATRIQSLPGRGLRYFPA